MTSNDRNKQVVYQASPNAVQTMNSMKEQLHRLGRQYANRPVRVQTLDGVNYEGVLSHTDGGLLFLVIPGQQTSWDPQYGHYDHYGHPTSPYSSQGNYAGYNRGLFGSSYYNNVILPLVLYELLVISLL